MMQRNFPLLLLLVLGLAAIIPVASAAAITFSSGSSDYYFGLGEPAEIPVTVTSTYDHDVDGTIQFAIAQQLQNTGMVMTSTQNRVYSQTISPGTANFTLNGGSSDVEKSVRVQLTYDYTDGSPVTVTLPEIVIHFVKNPPQSSGPQSPVKSTSAAGTGNVPSSSSVQIVQQAVSVQQQAGRDGTVQQALTGSQLSQDANALKEQLQREAEQAAQEKASLEASLGRDPLLMAVNQSLADEGYSRQALSTNPSSADTGTFSMEYRNARGESVTLAGAITDGTVPSVTETSAAPVGVASPLAANASFRSMDEQLRAQGFLRNTTLQNITLSGAGTNLTYTDPQGKRAYINATTLGQDVTSLSLAIEPEVPFDYLPVVAAVVAGAIVLAAAWILYRRLRRQKDLIVPEPAHEEAPPVPFDHRQAALALLARAETAYQEGRQAEACGLAGQALRLSLSHGNGARHEMTNAETIAFLRAQNRESRRVQEALALCTDVEFARGTVEAEGFGVLVTYIRDVIEKGE